MAVTAAMVKELREMTGAGMMDCKKALTETNGDIEEAIKILRTKGQAVQLKRADKEAKQGLVATAGCEKCGAWSLVEVNCETDFVAKTEGFQAFVKKAAELVVAGETNLAEALKDDIGDLVAKTGEKTIINRSERYTLQGPGKIQSYIHMGGKIGVLVELETPCDKCAASAELAEAAHMICLQVAANAPKYVAPADVPQAEIDAELEIKLNALKEQKGKLPPEQALVGIKKGMAAKFCTQICLLKQDYVADGDMTVEKYLEGVSKTIGAPITVKRFARLQLGA